MMTPLIKLQHHLVCMLCHSLQSKKYCDCHYLIYSDVEKYPLKYEAPLVHVLLALPRASLAKQQRNKHGHVSIKPKVWSQLSDESAFLCQF